MNGMDDDDDEHNFSDDDFEDLADDALDQLEHSAILSTQQAPQAGAVSRPQPLAELNRPPVNQFSNVLPHLQNALDETVDQESFDTVGEERVATPVDEAAIFIPRPQRPPGESTQREQWRQNRFGKPLPQYRPQIPNARSKATSARQPTTADSHRHPNTVSTTFGGTQNSWAVLDDDRQNMENGGQGSLSARVEQLLKERERLSAELKQAKDMVMTQKGEISIIRENKERESTIYDRQLAALQKSMQEENTKHKTAVDSLTSKHNSLITEFNMTKDDLKEETRRARNLELRLRDRPGEKVVENGTTSTPQKQRPSNSLRDGFDDDEIMVMSPARSASRRSKPATPTAANRRKRKVDPSPVKPLVLRPGESVDSISHIQQATQAKHQGHIVRRDRRAERSLRLLQRVFDYNPKGRRERLIEALAHYAFPEDKDTTFATIVLDSAARLTGDTLPADLLQIFLDLWSRSLKEKYYDCVALLLEVVNYMLDVQTTLVDKGTITNLLSVLQDSAAINGWARFKHSPVHKPNFGQFRPTPKTAINPSIDSTACLGVLYKIACLSLDSEELIDHFWRSMTTDFVLMMLNSWQPIADITIMLHLLATSIFPTTFGNVCADPSTQNTMETHIINRVSYLLWETPKADEGLQNPTQAELGTFRLEALGLLDTLAIDVADPARGDPNHHGSVLLALHPSAIARIVRALYDATASLYLMTSTAAMHAQLINQGVRLLYHIMSVHGNEIDLQQKLSTVNGGVHKHRVVLTRLAFSVGWYIDADITDETCALATAMLEDSVTPDEAEMMIQAFPGFTGRRKEGPATVGDNDDEMDTGK
jgi:hypothetical protein